MSTQVEREREFQVSAESLYRAIIDFENYKNFLPEVVGSSISARTDDQHVRVKFEIEVMKRFSYELDFTLYPNKEVHWKLTEGGFFKTNQGRWVLNPQGNKTQVRYELEVGFGFLVPGWVTKKLTESNLPQMFDKFESRAKELTKNDR